MLRKRATATALPLHTFAEIAMMRIPFELLLLTSGVGALQSAFFGFYLFSIRKRRSLPNILLAVLLLVFAVRISKSLVYFFSDNHEVPTVIMNFGFGANLAIFPLLLLYLKSFFNPQFRWDWLKHSVHFILPFLVIALSGTITSRFWMRYDGYTISLWSGLLYLPFCVYIIYKNFTTINTTQRLWIISLTLGITIVWMGYFANFVLGAVSYITAPVSFSLVIYFLSYLGLKKPDIFITKERYQNSAYSDQQITSCFEAWQQLLGKTQIYTDPTITLPKAADMLKVTSNLLSETINRRTGHTFPDYINSLRIASSQVLLRDPACNLKIAAIAHDAGFNSISVFNAAFKKHTGMTPSAWRRQFSGRQD
ncbi:MAG TPA: AraC family transcriptional regulator [Cyclobacteriaceae bacterium]|nr:AraC family transcriptional regulator [Cyclobacteriaceae bacterium]